MNGDSKFRPYLLRWALLAVCLLYLLQLWTPLRLSGDSIELLSVGSSVADGHGFLDHGQKTRYPPGYPAMVAGLDRLGLARPWSLVALNAVFLCLGFACAGWVARNYLQLSGNWATTTLLFTALSFVLIKYFTQPLTDIPFFGASLAALALTVRAERELGVSYYVFWAAALSVSVVSVLIRPTGIALFPCLVWSLGAHLGLGRILLRNKRLLIGCGALTALLGAAAAMFLLRTIYVRGALLVFAHQGLGHGILDILRFREQEIGELFLNVPATKLGPFVPLVRVSGVAGLAVLLVNARHCRMGTVEAFLTAYLFILLLWPYADARFWVPVLPLILAELFSAARPWTFSGWKKGLSVVYAAAYALMGVAALAYSTWITFSGPKFPLRYGDGKLRATYQAFYSQRRPDDSAKIDAAGLEVLGRYAGNSSLERR